MIELTLVPLASHRTVWLDPRKITAITRSPDIATTEPRSYVMMGNCTDESTFEVVETPAEIISRMKNEPIP